jgi:hypothetical protein
MSPVAALFADLIAKHRFVAQKHPVLAALQRERMERLDGSSRVYLWCGKKWGTA